VRVGARRIIDASAVGRSETRKASNAKRAIVTKTVSRLGDVK